MQFTVTAYDYKDNDALNRRLNAREEHLKYASQLKEERKLLYATALINDEDTMVGSLLIYEFTNLAELEECLENDPYTKGQVWEKTDIKPCKVPALFKN